MYVYILYVDIYTLWHWLVFNIFSINKYTLTCWWDYPRRHEARDRMWHDVRILWGGDTLSPLRRPSRSGTETNKQKIFTIKLLSYTSFQSCFKW